MVYHTDFGQVCQGIIRNSILQFIAGSRAVHVQLAQHLQIFRYFFGEHDDGLYK